MRWRFIDRITVWTPWQAITGVKAVSLEEYYLHERLGRQGALPESLLVATCDDLVRWLVAASSEFSCSSTLAAVDGFTVHQPALMGTVLVISARVEKRDDHRLAASCQVAAGECLIAGGRIEVDLVALETLYEADERQGTWRAVADGTA
jgi:hypothetical protein